MAFNWIDTMAGSLEKKKQYRQDKARIDALPDPYGAAAKAMHRYLLYAGGITDGDTVVTMLGDLADLWERAAADGTAVREIMGDDPGEFAEFFAQCYSRSLWLDKERTRLVRSIEDAERKGRN